MSKELWLVKGRIPVLWTIPAVVVWDQPDKGRLANAVALRARQQQAFDAVIDGIADSNKDGFWVVSRVGLEMVAKKLEPGTDPENVFTWERIREAQKPEYDAQRPLRADRDEFLDAFYQSGIGQSRDEVEFWWNQFCKHIQDWLLNKQKPVDMYFLKLHLCPYRMNWKMVLLSRYPLLGRLLWRYSGAKREMVAIESGLTDSMVCLDLLAMSRRHRHVMQHVEIEHLPLWWKNMERVEQTRYKLLGALEYAQQFIKSVRRRADLFRRLYVQSLAYFSLPTAVDVECGVEGEFRLAPVGRRPAGAWKRARVYEVPVVVANKDAPYKLPSHQADIFGEARPLPQPMRFVQLGGPDMRDDRPALPGSGNGEEASGGVLVPYADEGGDGSELLAVRHDAGPTGPGLAEGTEQLSDTRTP